MTMAYYIIGTVIAVAGFFLVPTSANAQVQNKGLFIAPLRQEVKLAAGTSASGDITIANYTDKPMSVTVTTKRYTVTGIDYQYKFLDIRERWTKLEPDKIELQPGERREVKFRVSVPDGTGPGGYYVSILASTTDTDGGLPITLQATSLLNLTVDGDLRYESDVVSAHVPFFTLNRSVPYWFDVKNTGNVHFGGEFFARLGDSRQSAEHLVFPDTTRRLSGEVVTPVWPGLYEVTYGYTPSYSGKEVVRTARIVYVPPWSMIILVLVTAAGISLLSWHVKRKSKVTD